MKKIKSHSQGKTKRSQKIGLPPGTAMFIGEKKREDVQISIIQYSEDFFNEKNNASLEDCLNFKEKSPITWINISGIHDSKTIESIGKHFKFHSLTIEDIVNTAQRPKTEEYDTYFFIVLKMMTYNRDQKIIETEHLSLIFGEGYVITFQEDEGDVFDFIRERLRSGKNRIKKNQSDYLAYSLIDAVMDNYFLALELLGDDVDQLDQEILSDSKPKHIQQIHGLKRHMLMLRKAVWPLREEVGTLLKSSSSLLHDSTKIFFRDLYDHIIQAIDMIEMHRESVMGMYDIYLSNINFRMNEVMKFLTLISTIFIPLTFIVGVYGMNFENMPELKWDNGYYYIWTAMIISVVGMILYFKKRRWF
ncbi:MAG: magnesium/cobalt transporter CorA [Pseudomonadota bacterium]